MNTNSINDHASESKCITYALILGFMFAGAAASAAGTFIINVATHDVIPEIGYAYAAAIGAALLPLCCCQLIRKSWPTREETQTFEVNPSSLRVTT